MRVLGWEHETCQTRDQLWDTICGWLDLADAKILRAQIAGSGILDIVSQIGIGQG
ncbi:hypothetical protein Vi05172_g4011 [Venturia inaequalis]|nr:hypothetical protein Vi05172_g4011 [Venturia inaequalis]